MTATFYVGDAISVMGSLPASSVDLVLSSPPFLALRSYLPADHPDKNLEGGSQATPGEYIDWLLDVVEACARVLAPHGSLVFELGDTYAGSGGAGGDYNADGLREGQEKFSGSATGRRRGGSIERSALVALGLMTDSDKAGSGWPQAKSLSLIPESFRWAMVYGHNPFTGRQCDTWRLRNVIRWVRPNPPVGALGDKFRPATSELMVFCKAKDRYFDLDAVREPYAEITLKNKAHVAQNGPKSSGNYAGRVKEAKLTHSGAPPLDWWNIPLLDGDEETRYGPKDEPWVRKVRASGDKGDPNGGRDTLGPYAGNENPLGSPPLDWWNIPPGGYSGAHYAVFPPELLIKPIKAMCPEKVCRVCGEPSRRIVERTPEYDQFRKEAVTMRKDPGMEGRGKGNGGLAGGGYNRDPAGVALGTPGNILSGAVQKFNTLGFSDCGHDDWRPGLVLDPFGGSGTTALVATGHGRDCILVDLDERNYELALERVGPFILTRAETDTPPT